MLTALVFGLTCFPLPLPAAVDNDGLIREVHRQSGIVIVRDKTNENGWGSLELNTLKDVLAILPPEYKSLKTIRVIKKHNKSGVSFSRREIYIDASSPPKDRDSWKQRWVRVLTRFLDRDYRISERAPWRNISRWTGWDFLGNKAENKNPRGFALPEGRKSPADDFATSAQLFFASPAYPDPAEYLKYRLPSKYRFIQNLFQSRPDPQKNLPCAKRPRKQKTPPPHPTHPGHSRKSKKPSSTASSASKKPNTSSPTRTSIATLNGCEPSTPKPTTSAANSIPSMPNGNPEAKTAGDDAPFLDRQPTRGTLKSCPGGNAECSSCEKSLFP